MTDLSEPGIVFWTEGGRAIGMGHLRRSLVIAKQCLEVGQQSLFVINDDPFAKDRLSAEGFPFQLGRLDGQELPTSLAKAPRTVVFDTKKDIAPIIEILKGQGHRVVILDNITAARISADVVIYPAAQFVNDLDWQGFCGCVYWGAEYVPVAAEYIEARQQNLGLKHQPPYRITVTMGGSDPQQLTYRVTSSLLSLGQPIEVRVVIGPAFMPDDRLAELERAGDPSLRFIKSQSDLSSLMADSHVAITAVGTTLYELAMVGVPAIIIANYAEDRRDMDLYRKLGMNLPLGYYEDVTPSHLREAVSWLLRDTAMWQRLRKKGWRTIDGQGARRIARLVAAENENAHV